MTSIQTLAIVSISDETYHVNTKRQNNLDVFIVEKVRRGKPTLFQRLWPRSVWHSNLEAAIEACTPISTGALALQLMMLGLTVYGIDLNKPPQEKSSTVDIYDFSGL